MTASTTAPVRPYVVRKGDYLTKLGHEMGFDPAWVWQHPRNEELTKKRRSWDMLKPGDLVWVPDAARRRMPVESEATNAYVARVPKVPLVVTIKVGGKVLPKEPYVLRGMGKLDGSGGAEGAGARKDEITGETDEQGRIALAPSVHVKEVEIDLPRRKKQLRLFVAGLAPDNELSGVRMRLKNLGYLGAKHLGAEGYEALDPAQLEAAVRDFQADQGLEQTGVVDDALQAKLVEVHGS
jgi:hypothetical protein